MAFIKWRDSYSVGVEQFDREHRKLIELIDTMYYVVRDKKGNEYTAEAASELVAYTKYHFTNEEGAMVAANYPDLGAHKVEHARLREKTGQLQERIENNDSQAAQELYIFLRDWLITHIQEIDKKYGPFLKD
jgi:hemerythrin